MINKSQQIFYERYEFLRDFFCIPQHKLNEQYFNNLIKDNKNNSSKNLSGKRENIPVKNSKVRIMLTR